MTFRYTRHTKNLEILSRFYVDIIGLCILGEFKNHNNYNGVFLGYEGADWHIEFTESSHNTTGKPDPDDLLVFYPRSAEEFNQILLRIRKNHIPELKARNPYWNQHGIKIADPDGFGIIINRGN
ncbi:MAG: VOC family protein [Luteibaculum sp.]